MSVNQRMGWPENAPVVEDMFAVWFRAHDEYHQASADYNKRLELVAAERARDNWTMNAHQEYAALNEAQRGALKADETLYQAMLVSRQ